MIAASRLRSIGILMLLAGAALFVIGLMIRQSGANLTTSQLMDVNQVVQHLQTVSNLMWGGGGLAVVGFILWIVGYLKGDGPGAAQAAGAQGDWQYRRIAGRMVYYKQAQDEFSVSIDGAQKTFSNYGALEDFVRSYERT